MDTEKLWQAVEEAIWSFVAFFAISFLGWASGWTVLPDLDAGVAAIRAAIVAGVAGAGKGLLWFFTGTPVGEAAVPPPHSEPR